LSLARASSFSILPYSSLVELLNFAIGDGILISEVLSIESGFAQNNSDHGDLSFELQVIESFLKRLILIND
jgi:hypothetical protein